MKRNIKEAFNRLIEHAIDVELPEYNEFYGEDMPTMKLTEDDAKEVRELLINLLIKKDL